MSDLIHPCTEEAANHVASNLRPEDFREVLEGWGMEPTAVIPFIASDGHTVSFNAPDGRIAGLAGIQNDGRIWMLCTNVIDEYPIHFIREAKRFIDKRTEPILFNVVDKRNTLHLKLLKHIGFTFLREVEWGPKKLTFIEFCRVCTSSSPHIDGGSPGNGSNRRASVSTSTS